MPTTVTMSISLPDTLKKYIQERVEEGDFSNPSDYIRTLVREERNARASKQLEALLIEGLESGEPVEVTDIDEEELMEEVNRRIAERAKKRA